MIDNNVTVLLPVFNGGKYLEIAIESILNQTYKYFELLIINDGSTDNTDEIVKKFKDTRIRYIRNPINYGLIETLNIGISESKSIYIARMDQDDISLPKRLEKQIKFMDRNENVGICGSYTQIFGDGVKSFKGKFPIDSEVIKSTILFNTAIPHPTMFIRKNFLDRFNIKYRDYPNVEDLAFCLECSHHFKMANLPEVLLKYRISNSSMTVINDLQMRKPVFIKIYKNTLKEMGVLAKDFELELHYQISSRSFIKNTDFIEESDYWLNYLTDINKRTKTYCTSAFAQVIALQWYKICSDMAKIFGLQIWKRFNKSLLIKNYNGKNILSLKLFYKCLNKFAPNF